ncbi:DUF4349 domain-containing protein [Bacillus sp. 165]|uniref:DUF4349 domain-containing protein n=1 Tax=Bacillus sp. 165 TaxID=1529117 RepID=UPI001ADB2842|nr:DUF4349 domain-containing protein [Bacillus sp. 165]MBO9130991.1 DUF4349 domain-containing protein [Bacillus sp. 165]
MKLPTPLIILLTVLITLAGCGANNESSSNKNMEMAHPESINGIAPDAKQETTASRNNTDGNKEQSPLLTNRKLIKNAVLSIETTNFDESIKILDTSIKKFNGYIEASNITGTPVHEEYSKAIRSASYTIRIPASSLDQYLSDAGDIGNILSKTINTDDVTNQYFDTEARITSLKIQEQRLLELLKQTGTLKDIIELEKELSSVRYEIETLTTTLQRYDSLVEYSTIHLTLVEVASLTDTSQPNTVSERITHTFKSNINGIWNWIKNATVFFIGNSPILLLICGIITAGILIIRKLIKKQKNNNISG